jgi:hypothetical protein
MTNRTWVAIAVLLVLAMSLTSWRALARAGESTVTPPADEAPQTQAPPELKALPPKLTMKKSAEAQRVTLSGTGFEQGLSVRMETPGGYYIVTFGPNALTSVTEDTIELDPELSEAGTYLFYVVNPDRQRSNAIALRVR